MNAFEFLFSFYGLLLGLAVANVATGFADMWRARTETAVGWCMPLLGLSVLLGCAKAWLNFWDAREVLTFGPWPMLTAIGVALPVIFVSRAMFPRSGDPWPSLEDYYLSHRRVLLLVLLIPTVVAVTSTGIASGWPGWTEAGYYAFRVGLLLVLVAVRSVWIQRVGLAVLNLGILWSVLA